MKNILIAAALLAATLTSFTTPTRAANIDVSINIGQPGYYGPLDIVDFGRPQVIYREPRIIERVSVQREPIYLHVPRGHAKNWRKHCGKYNACGERVYFVQDSWYNKEYVPRYQARHRERHEDRRDDRQERREDSRDKDHRGDHGDKKQHGDKKHGHGHGKDD